MRKTIVGIAGTALMAAALIAPSGASATALSYNQAVISPAVLQDGEVTEKILYGGADASLSASGTETYAIPAGNSKYVAKPTTSENFASASLASGSLKTHAYLGYGANLPYDDDPWVGSTNYGRNAQQTGAWAAFGDSFQTYSGNTPYVWSDGTTASFHFAVSGNETLPSVIADTIGTPMELTSKTQIYSIMRIYVYKSGTLDLIRQLNDLASGPWDDAAAAQYEAISLQANANLIANQYWYLGQPVGSFDDGTLIGLDTDHIVSLDNGPAQLDFDFIPGGDFDWEVQFDTDIRLDSALEDVAVDLDFSHTVVTSYDAPDGATTYSASGLFPDTLALNAAPGNDVPEPASWALMLAGLGLLGAAARRRGGNAVMLAA